MALKDYFNSLLNLFVVDFSESVTFAFKHAESFTECGEVMV